MKRLLLFPLAGLLMAVSPGQSQVAPTKGKECVAEHYKVIALPLLPRHINNSSQVAGTTSAHGAALWTEREALRPLGLPPGFASAEATSNNGVGQAVGFAADTSSSKRRGFRYADGKLTLLPGAQAKPYAINDAGQIVGEAIIPGKAATRPVLWKGQTLTDLQVCCGGTAIAVNNKGQVAGNMYDQQARYHGFLWESGHGIQPLGPQDDFSSAIAINDAGHVVVDEFSRGVFLYEDGKLTHLDLSPDYPSEPTAINNCDVLVGSFGPYADAQRAFVWGKKYGFHDLNQRIPPDSGWKLERATSINDQGEIIGWGDHNGAEDAGFLLIPQW